MGSLDGLNTFTIWILKVAYLNILWILFSFVGLGIFGIFPSTGAMFTIVQKWLRKDPVDKLFITFWKYYKAEFVSLNKFGLFFFLFGYFLVYDFIFSLLNSDKLLFLIPIIGFIAISFFLILLFFFPLYTQFEMTFFQYLKQSFLVGASSLKETVIIFTSCILMLILIKFFPGIIPFFTGSVLALVITWSSNRALHKISSRKKSIYQ